MEKMMCRVEVKSPEQGPRQEPRAGPSRSAHQLSSCLKEVGKNISQSFVMGSGVLQVMGTKPFVQVT